MAPLHLRVMGGFAVVLPTGQPVEVSGKKNRAMLTYLALHTDKKLTREKGCAAPTMSAGMFRYVRRGGGDHVESDEPFSGRTRPEPG